MRQANILSLCQYHFRHVLLIVIHGAVRHLWKDAWTNCPVHKAWAGRCQSLIPLIATDPITMSDRQLRSSITNPRTGNKRLLPFDGFTPSRNSKPKKRRKVEYRCVRCGQNKPSRSFPRTNPTPRCDHDINTCKECLQAWVDTQIRDDLLVAGVRDNRSYRLRCP